MYLGCHKLNQIFVTDIVWKVAYMGHDVISDHPDETVSSGWHVTTFSVG